MSVLQWALLLLGIGVAVLLIVSSRRERRALRDVPDSAPTRARVGSDWSATGASDTPAGADRSSRSFDEFGVSRPRKRTAPQVSDRERQQPLLQPESGGKIAPSVKTVPRIGSTADNRAARLIGFYIAEHERTDILGSRIHAALGEQGLEYGARRIYHRVEGDETLFSVASLVKPGYLDPGEADAFSTPGLSVFMVLPGPSRPVAAFQEMLATSRRLAQALNAELFDTEQRALLTAERERELLAQVKEWARRHATAGAPV